MRKFLEQQPDKVEAFAQIAARFDESAGYQDAYIGGSRLSVHCGSEKDPSHPDASGGGYWTIIQLHLSSHKDSIAIGGIFGTPCRRHLGNVIEVPALIADFLIARGWMPHKIEMDWDREGHKLVRPHDLTVIDFSRAVHTKKMREHVDRYHSQGHIDELIAFAQERRAALA
jgi:hypothetical protein